MAITLTSDVDVAQLETILFDEMALDYQAPFFVALSGGLDSTVLLHLLSNLPNKLNLIALHLNHQLQKQANDWQDHCHKLCDELNVPVLSKIVDINQLKNNNVSSVQNKAQGCDKRNEKVRKRERKEKHKGIEALARETRYDWFQSILSQTEKPAYLLTAHHLQDSAETLLFNLLRGSGSRGLSSMRGQRYLAKQGSSSSNLLVRPLLNFSRAQLFEYAQRNELTWVEDPSNKDVTYSRNFIRHNIIPELVRFRKDAVQNIVRAANNLESDNEVLNDMAQQDLLAIKQPSYHPVDKSYALCVDDLRGLSEARQRNVLMFWFAQHEFPFLSHDFIQTLISAIKVNMPGSSIFQRSAYQIRFYDGYLYAMPALQDPLSNKQTEHDNLLGDKERVWSINKPLFLSEHGINLTAKQKLIDLCQSKSELSSAKKEANKGSNKGAKTKVEVLISQRNQCASLISLNERSVQLKKVMNTMKVVPWRRFLLPVLILKDNDKSYFLSVLELTKENDWCDVTVCT